MDWVEIVGYGASLLVAVSFLMSSVVRLRAVNLVGALVFAVYGVLTGAWPVILVNVFIAAANVWHLAGLGRREAHIALVEVAGLDDPLVRRLRELHGPDIARTFPDFDDGGLDGARVVLILRDLATAGIVVWTEEDETARIHLDWVLPAYRDLRCARFFLEHTAPAWRARGLRRVESPAAGQTHRDYLLRLGFLPGPAADSPYVRELSADDPAGA